MSKQCNLSLKVQATPGFPPSWLLPPPPQTSWSRSALARFRAGPRHGKVTMAQSAGTETELEPDMRGEQAKPAGSCPGATLNSPLDPQTQTTWRCGWWWGVRPPSQSQGWQGLLEAHPTFKGCSESQGLLCRYLRASQLTNGDRVAASGGADERRQGRCPSGEP